jgi:hypothetical protein
MAPARARRLAGGPRRDPSLRPGALDRPSAEQPIAGPTVDCAGWAWPFPDQRVRSVDVLIDGAPAGRARLTLRPDIAEALERPEAALAGFEAQLAPPPGDREEVRLSAQVRGLAGGAWTLPERIVRVDRGAPSAGVDAATGADQREPAAEPAPAAAETWDRELQRGRLGYDPWHTVVLIDGPAVEAVAGPAVAALDAIAERHPGLELLIAGVPPESVLADLLRRTIGAAGLEDRVTVPRIASPAGYWRTVADVPLDATTAGDLAATIDRLSQAARRGAAGD